MFNNTNNYKNVGHESINNYKGLSFRDDMLRFTGTQQDKTNYIVKWLLDNLKLSNEEIISNVQDLSQRDIVRRNAKNPQEANKKIIKMHQDDIDKALGRLRQLNLEIYNKMNPNPQEINSSLDADRERLKQIIVEADQALKEISLHKSEGSRAINEAKNDIADLKSHDAKIKTLNREADTNDQQTLILLTEHNELLSQHDLSTKKRIKPTAEDKDMSRPQKKLIPIPDLISNILEDADQDLSEYDAEELEDIIDSSIGSNSSSSLKETTLAGANELYNTASQLSTQVSSIINIPSNESGIESDQNTLVGSKTVTPNSSRRNSFSSSESFRSQLADQPQNESAVGHRKY